MLLGEHKIVEPERLIPAGPTADAWHLGPVRLRTNASDSRRVRGRRWGMTRHDPPAVFLARPACWRVRDYAGEAPEGENPSEQISVGTAERLSDRDLPKGSRGRSLAVHLDRNRHMLSEAPLKKTR